MVILIFCAIACPIRNNRTEKRAIEWICGILRAWNEEIYPEELGACAPDS